MYFVYVCVCVCHVILCTVSCIMHYIISTTDGCILSYSSYFKSKKTSYHKNCRKYACEQHTLRNLRHCCNMLSLIAIMTVVRATRTCLIRWVDVRAHCRQLEVVIRCRMSWDTCTVVTSHLGERWHRRPLSTSTFLMTRTCVIGHKHQVCVSLCLLYSVILRCCGVL